MAQRCLSLVVVLGMAFGLLALPARADVEILTVVRIANQTVEVGSTFKAYVEIAAVEDLAGFQMDLRFNRDMLEILAIREGDFLKQNGETFWIPSAIDNREGTVTGIRCARTTPGGVSGDGILFEVELRAKIPGNATLSPRNLQLGNSEGVAIRTRLEIGTFTIPNPLPADVNGDGRVDILDLILVAQNFGRVDPSNHRLDVNGDGRVDILDLILVAQRFGSTIGGAPQLPTTSDTGFLARLLNEARSADDGSPTFRRGIETLERLLRMTLPTRTALLRNYPNPFNPETWIPYDLADAADVTVTIYDTAGRTVRRIEIGHREAGSYRDPSRAAYWDGRSTTGELVSSGVYYVELRADRFRAVRRMAVLK